MTASAVSPAPHTHGSGRLRWGLGPPREPQAPRDPQGLETEIPRQVDVPARQSGADPHPSTQEDSEFKASLRHLANPVPKEKNNPGPEGRLREHEDTSSNPSTQVKGLHWTLDVHETVTPA